MLSYTRTSYTSGHPVSATQDAIGGVSWANLNYVIDVSTSNYASATLVTDSNTNLMLVKLKFSGFPADGIISGVVAGIRLACAFGFEGLHEIAEVSLFCSGEDISPANTSCPLPFAPYPVNWINYGSSADKWGFDDSLTSANIISNNLGLRFLDYLSDGGSTYVRVYAVRIVVYYAYIPETQINLINAITSSSANINCELMYTGDDPVTVSGVCYSTHENPTITDSHTTDGGLTEDVFTSPVSGLLPNTTYYVRSYATNGVATGYSVQSYFKTLCEVPVLSDIVIVATGSTSISLSSSISYDGGGTNVSGFCYSTHENPTIADSCTTGGLEDALTGLLPETLYYVRAYSTNDSFTGYSNQTSFALPNGVHHILQWKSLVEWEKWKNNDGSAISITEDSLTCENNRTICYSPVVDTGEDNNILSYLYSVFSSNTGAGIRFGFRASNDLFAPNSTSVSWSGFTHFGQIVSETGFNLSEIGAYSCGRYHQIRILFNSEDSVFPGMSELTASVSPQSQLLKAATAAYLPGSVIAQVVSFTGNKTIHKISLDVLVNSFERKSTILSSGNSICFHASNFQDSRSSWVFQPIPVFTFLSNGTPVSNTLQTEDYLTSDSAILSAPYLSYSIYFPASGSYDLWGYGYTEKTIFWSLDDDQTNLRISRLGDTEPEWEGIPRWTKIGTVFFEEGGVYSFNVYLSELQSMTLDQWCFTQNYELELDFNEIGASSLTTPLPVSKCPFTTAVRLRSLNGSELDDLASPHPEAKSITAWLSSKNILADGKCNYEIRDNEETSGLTFVDGVSVEYWQIGGDCNNHAAWTYVLPDDGVGVGVSRISTNFGQTFL